MGSSASALDRRADDLDHPRPLLRRDGWCSLDGEWSFSDDPGGRWNRPDEVEWVDKIQVPFAPETEASGIGDTRYREACWYRRSVEFPSLEEGERLLLHFGAVDYAATIWMDSYPVAQHEGGYTSFPVDVTMFSDGRSHELVVRAGDDAGDLGKPRGKQDWELEPHAIWYPRTTGIWQTVWLERLPRVAVRELQWTSDFDRYEVCMQARLDGPLDPDIRLRIRLTFEEGRVLVDDLIGVRCHEMERAFSLDFRGLDTLRDALTWSPEHPALVDAVVEVVDRNGAVVDRVESYTAMRTVGVDEGMFVLNGAPYTLRLVLDQGYWPESGLTPPSGSALRRDVELAKSMGFNGVRKHQKIEDPRYLYWADRLGLLVWAEMPPCYRFDSRAVRRLVDEWAEVIERSRSHPCIVAWVPFNESTGTLSLGARADQRQYIEAVALLTQVLDPSRLVLTNDGWEGLGGDIVGIHDYDDDPESLRHRYRPEALADTLRGFGNSGRRQLLDHADRAVSHSRSKGPRALMLSEFGGIGFTGQGPILTQDDIGAEAPADRLHQPAAWGYSSVATPGELLERYRALVEAALSLERFSGYCYTQFADTYQEVNGLLRGDRTPKAPLADIAAATLGPLRRRHGVVQPDPTRNGSSRPAGARTGATTEDGEGSAGSSS